MTTGGIVLEGFLDEETAADDTAGTRARFRLTTSPTDELVDEMTLPCSVADPELAHAVLHDLQPGDYIRVAGYLGLPRIAGHPMWLHVLTLELLDTAPPRNTDTAAPDDTGTQPTMPATTGGPEDATAHPGNCLPEHGLLERYADYLIFSDPDTATDTVWTVTGQWIGRAVYPHVSLDLIRAHQHRTTHGDT